MVYVSDANSGEQLGTLAEEQLRFLIAQLEEESLSDQDYYINRATLDMFEQRGADPQLLANLREWLGERNEMDIRWTE